MQSAAAVSQPKMQVTIARAAPSDSALETLRRNVADLNLRPVSEPLKEKDMIAFRIMPENYVPGMSEYIVGMVQAVAEAGAGAGISVHIMAGWEQTLDPQGKFSLTAAADDGGEVADGPTADSTDRTYQVQRADMFDVKYVQL